MPTFANKANIQVADILLFSKVCLDAKRQIFTGEGKMRPGPNPIKNSALNFTPLINQPIRVAKNGQVNVVIVNSSIKLNSTLKFVFSSSGHGDLQPLKVRLS